MAAPRSVDRRAALYDWAGVEVRRLVRTNFDPELDVILDVGAGWGKYRDLLPEFTMDACEVWQPNVDEGRLTDRYRHVYVDDIADLASRLQAGQYALAILGDVFEHLDRPTAQTTLGYLSAVLVDVLIVVPYLYPQDAVDGNPYEVHRQADLTPDLMAVEYPTLALYETDGSKGLYHRKGTP